jgi:DNA primase
MGFSGRLFEDGKKKIKYFSNYPSNMIWGYDKQYKDAKFCIVVEGLLDAVAISALAICSNEINETQAQVIETLDRDIIVVPDRDKAGMAMVEAALKYGWGVAFPDWESGIKDTADAVAKYGQLFTMRSILDSVQSSKLKIQLVGKKWF